jgi:flagellar hook-length control protein FliK
MKMDSISYKNYLDNIIKQGKFEGKETSKQDFKQVLNKNLSQSTSKETKPIKSESKDDDKVKDIVTDKEEPAKETAEVSDDDNIQLKVITDLAQLLKSVENSDSLENIESVLKNIVEEVKELGGFEKLLQLVNSSQPQAELTELIKQMEKVTDEGSDFQTIADKVLSIVDDNASSKEIIEQLNVLEKEVKNSSQVTEKVINTSAMSKAINDKMLKPSEEVKDTSGKTPVDTLASNQKVDTVQNGKETSDAEEGLMDNSSSKEDKLLKSILGDKETGNTKLFSLTEHLNRFRQDINTGNVSSDTQVINKTSFNADVIKAVKYMDLNNIKELTVNIAPKELGHVVIKLTIEAGVMKANISASNKEAYSILSNNLGDIRSSLSNMEIKVQDVAINIYNEDTTFFRDSSNNSGESFRNGSGGQQSDKGSARDTEEVRTIEEIGRQAVEDNNLSVFA